jgi:acid phosphatase (class A)
MTARHACSIGLLLALTWNAAAVADDTPPVPEIRPGILAGYLPSDAVVKSVDLLPEPPAEGSAAFALDLSISHADLGLEGSNRFKLAGMDADLSFPSAAGDYACALGTAVNAEDTPRLYQMLRRIATDAGRGTGSAKDKYRRVRPFMYNNQPTCSPESDADLRKNGSYPSGHTAIGWAWALTLAEAAPDRAKAIVARGRSFGESRIVCNVHWASDVIEGRFVADATVARLHAEPAYLADLAAAKTELAAQWAKGVPPQRDCGFEAQALSQSPPQTP